MLKIRRMNVLPPGGYRYVQPETGMVFGGNDVFPAQCKKILSHRRGNKLSRATLDEVKEDVIAATCARLPNLCQDLQIPAAQPIVNVLSPAKTLAVAIKSTPAPATTATRKVRKCGSCGGRKK